MESFLLNLARKNTKGFGLRLWIVICVVSIAILQAVSLEEYLFMGKPRGHLGLYYQDMTEKRSNFADINFSMGYDTPVSSNGLSFGGSFWLAARMYEYSRGDFNSTKDSSIWTEGYVRYNRNDRLRVEAGRFYANTEWIKYYNQGIRVDYALSPNVFANLMWVNKNAYVTNYRMSNYRNPFDREGVFFGSVNILPLQSPMKIIPYFYVAPNRFNAFGIKIQLEKPSVGDSVFYANVHLLSYLGKNQVVEQTRTDGDGGFVWVEGGVKWAGVKFGGGIISVSEKGASGIDAFGQSTVFERREGLFYADANTFYGLLEYTFPNHVVLESAARYTSIGAKQILNWEANAKLSVAPDVWLGGGFIGMLNNANITLDDYIFASDGKNYLLGRVFFQANF